MKLSQSLDLKLKQELTINQQMILKLHLLQVPLLEINEIIDEELEENPLLQLENKEEDVEKDVENPDEEFDWEEGYEDVVEQLHSPDMDEDKNPEDTGEEVSEDAEVEVKEVEAEESAIDDFSSSNVMETSSSGYEKNDYINNLPDKGSDIYTELSEQLHFRDLTPEQIKIGEFIIGNLNRKGYLITEPVKLAEDLEISLEEFEEVRQEILLELDPPGCGCIDLRECLLAQLDDYEDELEYKIVKNYYKFFINNQIPNIIKRMSSYLPDDIMEAVNNIKNLNPFPGSVFYSGPDQIIIPDLIFEVTDDKIKILANDKYMPNLAINESYVDILKNEENKECQKFLKEKYNSANVLINAIGERKKTLLLVGEQIAKVQTDFFLDEGTNMNLTPFSLTQCAEELDFAVSTISRTVQNKYAQTPKGIYPLKFFFTHEVNDDQSDVFIKDEIRKLIDTEDKRNPYSDEEISIILKQRSIKISRRTVTKFRNKMAIPRKGMRREFV